MRFGDHRRGALVSRRGWHLLIEWWWNSDRYRVWRLGPIELRELPW